jgi:hypothetical protein
MPVPTCICTSLGLPAVSRFVGAAARASHAPDTRAGIALTALRNAPGEHVNDLIRRSGEFVRLSELHQACRHLSASAALRMTETGEIRKASPGVFSRIAHTKPKTHYAAQVTLLSEEVTSITNGSLSAVRGCHLAQFAESAARRLESVTRTAFPSFYQAVAANTPSGAPVADAIIDVLVAVNANAPDGLHRIEKMI